MAKKVLKTRTQFTSTLNKELYERLGKVSDDTMIPKPKLLDIAVEELLKKFEK